MEVLEALITNFLTVMLMLSVFPLESVTWMLVERELLPTVAEKFLAETVIELPLLLLNDATSLLLIDQLKGPVPLDTERFTLVELLPVQMVVEPLALIVGAGAAFTWMLALALLFKLSVTVILILPSPLIFSILTGLRPVLRFALTPPLVDRDHERLPEPAACTSTCCPSVISVD